MVSFAELLQKKMKEKPKPVSDLPTMEIPTNIGLENSALVYKTNWRGEVFVFTGIRDHDLETRIHNLGGIIADTVVKSTTYVVRKDDKFESTKTEKAIKYNAKIITINEVRTYVKAAETLKSREKQGL